MLFVLFCLIGMTCLLEVPDRYVRGKVVKACLDGVSGSYMYTVYTLDHGRTVTVERSRLRRYRNEIKMYFDEFPPLAIACSLRGAGQLLERGASRTAREWTAGERKQMREIPPFLEQSVCFVLFELLFIIIQINTVCCISVHNVTISPAVITTKDATKMKRFDVKIARVN